ncbi:MAG: hypothetical protein HOA17_08590 [Candidatus Melainabacteria bacterium]|jgi:hypothetical protein|nr:hypothetical protein [Candidatus Melainabacteria bacterium]
MKATKIKKKLPSKQELIDAWQEAKPIKGKNPTQWRKDSEGNIIRFADYDGSGKFAWEIG